MKKLLILLTICMFIFAGCSSVLSDKEIIEKTIAANNDVTKVSMKTLMNVNMKMDSAQMNESEEMSMIMKMDLLLDEDAKNSKITMEITGIEEVIPATTIYMTDGFIFSNDGEGNWYKQELTDAAWNQYSDQAAFEELFSSENIKVINKKSDSFVLSIEDASEFVNNILMSSPDMQMLTQMGAVPEFNEAVIEITVDKESFEILEMKQDFVIDYDIMGMAQMKMDITSTSVIEKLDAVDIGFPNEALNAELINPFDFQFDAESMTAEDYEYGNMDDLDYADYEDFDGAANIAMNLE